MDVAKKSKNALRKLLATGCVLFLVLNFTFCWYAVIKPSLALRAAKAATSDCMRNVMRMNKAILIYSQDWDNTLPPANRWQNVVQSHISSFEQSVFTCGSGKSANSYGLNKSVDGINMLSVKEEPPAKIMFFETDSPMPNAIGGPLNLPAECRHGMADIYGFLDGHCGAFQRNATLMVW